MISREFIRQHTNFIETASIINTEYIGVFEIAVGVEVNQIDSDAIATKNQIQEKIIDKLHEAFKKADEKIQN